jgi:hypothetical protein
VGGEGGGQYCVAEAVVGDGAVAGVVLVADAGRA